MSTASKKGNNKGLLIFLSVALLGLAGVCVYLFSELSASQEKTIEVVKVAEKKQDDIGGLLAQLDEKEAEYTRIIQEKEALGYDVTDLEQERQALLEDIKTWKVKAKQAGRDTKKLRKQLQIKNAQYTLELAEKDHMISFLKTENDSLNTTTKALSEHKHVQASIIQAQNDKIQMGSVLRAEHVNVSMKTTRDKTTMKQPFRGSKIGSVALHFNIAKNEIASFNKKKIAMRLVGPDGAVLYDLASGGGSLRTNNNEMVYYTLKQNLLFDNTNQTLTFPYAQDKEWAEGEYRIYIYADGHTIGKSGFKVK